MTKELYLIFSRCFPRIPLDEESFYALSRIGAADGRVTVFTAEESGRTVGFAALEADKLRLLCVLPEARNRGFGTRLLGQAEQAARLSGFRVLTVGGTDSALLIGAAEESVGFFEKRGYRLGEQVAEMAGETARLRAAAPAEGVSFGFYRGSAERLSAAVRAVDEDWVQYFGEETIAENAVFYAYMGEEIASFCILGEDERCLLSDGKNQIGSIGCVGTVPSFRRKGIGLDMVSRAAEILKSRGCTKIFIHYTGVAHWYARLGFETFLRVRLGEKRIDRGSGR